MMRFLVATGLAFAPTLAAAAPLSVPVGETWIFSLDHGQPVKAHKATATANPKHGEIRVSVRAAFGTMMTITNNSAQGYTFDAQLVDASGKAVAARACTLPPNNQPALESWPQKSVTVRIGNFKPAKGGNC